MERRPITTLPHRGYCWPVNKEGRARIFERMDWKSPGNFQRNRRNTFLLLLTISCVTLLYYYGEMITMPYEYVSEEHLDAMKNYLSRSNRHFGPELKVDRSNLSSDDIVRNAQKYAPNFPIAFWEENKNRNLFYKNRSCSRFPNVYELSVNNLYWQVFKTKNMMVYLFGAYYDVRPRCSVCPAVRLLGTIDRQWVKAKFFCQIWYADHNEPLIVESFTYFYFMNDPNLTSYPGSLTCPIPPAYSGRVPIFVSLVENMCDTASNSLRVIFNKPSDPAEKKGFAVCVKMLDFLHDDQSMRLTEWIELVRILGADSIIVYTLFVHENMTKVLEYYERQGAVEITPTTLVGDEVNLPYFQHLQIRAQNWRQRWVNEVVQLNDCFYKNMYKYDYITLLDTDEVIMPHKENNWTALMRTVLNKASGNGDKSSYETSMVIFPHCENRTEVSMWYMLEHVLSDRGNTIQSTTKTFFDTEMVEALNNHRAVKCLGGTCKNYAIGRWDAELFHYRNAPYNKAREWSCDELVRKNHVDTTIWKYKEQLIDRTLVTLYDLGFYD